MTDCLARYNISIVDGFVKESTTFRELSSNAKCILANILSMTNGDLTKTASFLDNLLNETQIRIKFLMDGNLSDEEFYAELTKLKDEHRDTVDIIERLYLYSGKPDMKHNNKNALKEIDESEVPKGFLSNQLSSSTSICYNPDQTEPIPHEESTFVDFQNNLEFYQPKECEISNTQMGECECAKIRTDESINDNCYKNVRASSPPVTSWKHHITVPEPFEMTKREESLKRFKNVQSKSKSLQPTTILDDGNAHFGAQFKAKPIPSHVYLPLFEKLMEKNAIRREAIRKHHKEILKSTEKPFNFTIRENLKKEQNDFSRDKIRQDENFGTDKKPFDFKNDRPSDPLDLPSHLFERRFERMQEDLLLKEVKRHLRAQRLLQSASLPPGMEERQHRMDMRKQERKARNERLNRISTLDLDNSEAKQKHYRHYHPAPDFKQLHWKSSKNLRLLWKPPPEPTRPKSFKLRTSERANSLNRYSLQNNNNKMKKNDGENFSQSTAKQPVLDVPPPALSRSALLRENYIRNSLAKVNLDEKKKEEMGYIKRLKQREVSDTMKETLGGRLAPPKQIINLITEERKRQLIQNDLHRQAEYKRELNAIQQRVASKPLLVTRQNQILARKRAEAKFDASIRDAGLNLNELLENSYQINLQNDEKITSKKPITKVSVEAYDPENHFGDLGNN
ncbi:Protein FAM161A [Schistosoma japonicum]|nr:Protein FAM161A [Schistosoma japonicum]